MTPTSFADTPDSDLGTIDAAVSNSQQLSLLYVYNPGCTACTNLAPILEELHAEYAERLAFHKVNVVTTPEVWEAFEMSSIPTVFIVSDGQALAECIGVHALEVYRSLIADAETTKPITV